jgi:hypothetical protein
VPLLEPVHTPLDHIAPCVGLGVEVRWPLTFGGYYSCLYYRFSAKVQVTKGGTSDLQPSYSPDGKKIAYTRTTYRGDALPKDEIFTVNVGGGGKTNLTNTGYNVDVYMPSWGSRP